MISVGKIHELAAQRAARQHEPTPAAPIDLAQIEQGRTDDVARGEHQSSCP